MDGASSSKQHEYLFKTANSGDRKTSTYSSSANCTGDPTTETKSFQYDRAPGVSITVDVDSIEALKITITIEGVADPVEIYYVSDADSDTNTDQVYVSDGPDDTVFTADDALVLKVETPPDEPTECIREMRYTNWSNGNLKTQVFYHEDGLTVSDEYTYWEDGKLKTHLEYHEDGTLAEEFIYWENGNRKYEVDYRAGNKLEEYTYYVSGNVKTQIRYLYGIKEGGYPKCYTGDGTEETCNEEGYDGCIPDNDTCLPSGYARPVITVTDDHLSGCTGRATLWPDGKLKTRVFYYKDGVTVHEEYTYWENGNEKTYLEYHENGTLAEERIYWENGNRRYEVDYDPEENRIGEFTYYKRSGNGKTQIIYRNGDKQPGFPMCHKDDSMYIGSFTGTRDTCSPAVYGCTDRSDSCLPSDYASPVPLE